MRRSWVPARLTGATNNTLATGHDLLDVLDGHPDLLDGARSAELLGKAEGRPRGPGEWTLAYLLYVNSGERELERWHRGTADDLWQRIDFPVMPSYHRTYRAFAALEDHEHALRVVAGRLVRIAVERSGGKVGHAVHVDSTEADAHSRLVHDCTGSEESTCNKQPMMPRRSTPADERDERHRIAAQTPTDDDLVGSIEEMGADERGLRVRVGGCWYRLSDTEAGVRAYTSGDTVRKFWSGYYNAKAIDHYTGGVLAVHVTKASVQEHIAYPALFEQITEHLGQAPKAVVADRGYSVSSVFEANTRAGVASVIPWRTHWQDPTRHEHERYDRHGIPFCRHCAGESTYVRFQHDAGPNAEPRLWFKCARPAKAACHREQTIYCRENWRLLIPLWRTSPAYQVLRSRHSNYESTHHRWRERYAVAGDTKADRPKRRGLGVQQLRASAALVIEWVTICHMQGWLGGPMINDRQEQRLKPDEADSYCRPLLAARHALALTGVHAGRRAEHQADVLAAYSADERQYGPASAYGDEVTAMLEAEARARGDGAAVE